MITILLIRVKLWGAGGTFSALSVWDLHHNSWPAVRRGGGGGGANEPHPLSEPMFSVQAGMFETKKNPEHILLHLAPALTGSVFMRRYRLFLVQYSAVNLAPQSTTYTRRHKNLACLYYNHEKRG